MGEGDEPTVEIGVRELLKDIKVEQHLAFERLEKALGHKADKADLERIERRMDGQHERLSTLEAAQHDIKVAESVRREISAQHARETQTKFTRRERQIAGVVATLGVAATVLGPYIANHL